MKELPWDRLATTDQKGNRVYLYPTEVQGRWQKRRSRLSIGLIIFFLYLPWIRVGGQQAILLDIPQRRFALFGLTFWAHDAPMLFFVFGGAVILIAFVTAIWGRVWCGWACPQTVFVEHVFRRVERWIEGDALARRKLDETPMHFNKFIKKSLKFGVFSLISLILSHSFLAYFIGTEALGRMMVASPFQNPISFFSMIGIAGLILFDFGWFREQFCTVVCPYGRFQSVLMDGQSSVVVYDTKRGEPRRGEAPSDKPQGDCVNCYRCVQVCPTGIDIRRGTQMECVSCTACIDACDDVMGRLKKPLGLIRYGIQAMADGKTENFIPWFKRSRAWVYLGILVSFAGGLFFTLSHRAPIELTLIRAVDLPFQEIPTVQGKNAEKTQILNHFKADLRNQTFDPVTLKFTVNPELQSQGVNLVLSNHKESLTPGEPERADLFVQFPKHLLTGGRGAISIQLEAISSKTGQTRVFIQEVRLVGPLQ